MGFSILFVLAMPSVCLSGADGAFLKRDLMMDSHARNTPAGMEGSIKKLAAYLAGPAGNDREKVRALYAWVAHNITYDVKALKTGKIGDLSPEGVLKSRTSICSGYSALFQSLARAAGIEAVTIKGYSKGYGYRAGARFRSTNHAWNGVKINGKWHLLDTTWGAGYLNEQGKFVKRYSAHYFLTPPDSFIYDHLPQKSRWQLLGPPLSMQEYQELVYVKAAFFDNGLGIKSPRQGTVQTGNELTVKLSAPKEVLLMATILKGGKKLDDSHVFLQRQGGEFFIQALFPDPATYTVRIFAKSRHETSKYVWVLDYKVMARMGSKFPYGFPHTFAGFGEQDVFLIAPFQGNLKSGSPSFFKLRAPGAENVAVKIGKTWHDLTKKKELFSGTVPIAKGVLRVMAKYPGSEQYRGLLQFKGY